MPPPAPIKPQIKPTIAPQWLPFFLCIIFTFGFAQLAARIANRASAKTLNRATGIILVILGVVILGFSLLE